MIRGALFVRLLGFSVVCARFFTRGTVVWFNFFADFSFSRRLINCEFWNAIVAGISVVGLSGGKMYTAKLELYAVTAEGWAFEGM